MLRTPLRPRTTARVDLRSATPSGLRLILAALLSVATSARAQEAPAPDLAPLSQLLEAASCRTSEVLELEDHWYAACGLGGVLVLRRTDTGFQLVERRLVAGDARSVFARNGLVWIEIHQVAARPLHEAPIDPRGPSASTTSPVPAPSASSAVVPRAAYPTVRPYPATVAAARRPGSNNIAPERMGGLFSLGAGVRPMLPIDRLGFALIGQLSATYRGERAYYLDVQVFPFGGQIGKGGDVGLFGALASAGYDHRLFAVGLGVGVLRSYGYYYDARPTQMNPFAMLDEYRGELHFAVSQSARLGALDGLHIAVANTFTLQDDSWRYGYFDLTIQLPAGGRTWIVPAGGGGERAGMFYAEVGLRRLVRGERGSGSLFVRPSVGVAGVGVGGGSWSPGPMVGFHVEWRK